MISVSSSSSAPYHLEGLQKLFLLEWDEIDSFTGPDPNFAVPPPLLALDDQDKLVGGLSFTSFVRPGNEDLAVWINAVLVVPEYRRMGIASKLVREAAVEASRLSFIEMFVRTNISDLYQQLGWNVVVKGEPNTVLMKVLPNK